MPSRPVIAHVLHRLYLAGAEVLAAGLARQQANPHDSNRAYDQLFICLDEVGPLGEQLRADGFAVECAGREPGWDWSAAKRIGDICKRYRVDLLHAHQYAPFFYSAASRMWPVIPSPFSHKLPRILFTEHGREYPDYRRPKRIWANRLLFKKRDRVTAVGQWVREALIQKEALPAERIDVIYNGVDAAQFAPADEQTRAQMRQSLGILLQTPVVMQVARFHPVKDHETAIRAFAGVVKHRPDAVLLLVGDGEERANCEILARDLSISGSVRFLGVRDDVSKLLHAADVFLLSSLSEGISVTLLEAMGAGLPIVATAVGGNPEVVEHDVTGLLAPRKDSAGLADHLVALLNDPARAREMGKAGRQRLEEKLTLSRMHAAYAQVYSQMLGESLANNG